MLVGENFAVAIINDDYSGLSEEDIDLLNRFLEDNKGYFVITDEQPDFRQCTVSKLWDNCLQMEII